MKLSILVLSGLLISSSTVSCQASEEAIILVENSSAESSQQVATNANTLPFNLPLAANTRVIDAAQYQSGGRQELSMSLITTGSPIAVIDFYEKELMKAGFNIFSKTGNAKRVSVTGKHANGKDFSISNRTRTDSLSEGETELRVVAHF